MTRQQMLDNLIKKLGMEHPYVIYFGKLCEDTPIGEWNYKVLRGLYEAAMNHTWEEE